MTITSTYNRPKFSPRVESTKLYACKSEAYVQKEVANLLKSFDHQHKTLFVIKLNIYTPVSTSSTNAKGLNLFSW